ncbi:DUF4197 domain-containing protein [Shewanella gelidii]|uniref:DUF4197 domain-containing protein n=1 Tax=Shewanella gelidii TaxID=1642821 RepID=A0A917JUW1_9GAMM|nr:DUF4197 domain-containing protein [Shewanella gelidii]MCL1098044.1 DUF4197 domain-containing protein [Shewanella gelidii]GGI85713.1 hypothetical protein GCM10009332_23760 [Shewanella gelidii]
MSKLKTIYTFSIALLITALPTDTYADSWWETAKSILSQEETKDIASALPLENSEIEQAFRQALSQGAKDVVAQVSQPGGFNNDPSIHVPLPPELKQIHGIMDKFGFAFLLDDLESKLNLAAEKASPKAQALFVDAIEKMSFEDIQRIYQGPSDSATQYFKKVMSEPLGNQMRPIIDASIQDVGAVQAFDKVMKEYEQLPFMPDVKANLTDHVVEKGMAGLFLYMAQQEAEIRENPAKHTTDLLKKVFGE